ncbi:MAG: ACT domain-containing protein [Actinobacteria bacterium]|nr:ACT domain-containing protein [Actinomycetota bacterium]
MRVELETGRPGLAAEVAKAISDQGASISSMEVIEADHQRVVREIVVDATSVENEDEVVDAVKALDGITVASAEDRTFRLHNGGKIEMVPRAALKTREDLSVAYMPGVAAVARRIAEYPEAAFDYTLKRNMVAVITNGTAVLGLGDIGAAAGMPVMEGKSLLFKEFADVDSYAICVDTHDAKELIAVCEAIAPAFGGINLEDIAAPVCFEVEDTLKERLGIPVFHDDQHGTAVVVLAALINACKITGQRMEDLKVVVNGIGASGVACSKILMNAGVTNIIGCDTRGAIYDGRTENMNFMKDWYAENTNPEGIEGDLTEAIKGANMFVGLSGPGTFSVEQLKSMAKDPLVFAMANPTPEIMPEVAAPYVRVMATGRSDYPNQINNVLAFPGIFRGALDVRARQISEGMKVAAAQAIADVISADELHEDYIIPSVFNPDVAPAVAAETRRVAIEEGLARIMPED